MKTKIFPVFALLLLAVSCNKNESQTLVLHTPQQIYNTIILNWEQASVSDFEYYMVVRSSDQNRYEIINDIVTPTSNAFRKEITTFEDRSYPLDVDILYYKIMAVGKTIQSSQSLCYQIENPVRLIKGNIQDVHYIDEANKLSVLLYDYSEGHRTFLKTFDLETGQFSSNEAPVYLSTSTSWCYWGKYNGKTEFYNYGSIYTNGNIYVYDVSTLQQVASIETPYIGYGPYTVNNKGIIYVHSDYYLYLFSRITGKYTQYQSANYYDSIWLYYNSKDNKLYAVGNRIQTFILDDNGNVKGDEMYTIENLNYFPLYIENSSLFVVSSNSGIKILDMNTKTFHNTGLSRMPNVVLLNNNVIYAADTYSQIYKLSAGNYTLIETIPARVVPNKFFVNNGYLLFFGRFPNSVTYILDKIKL